MQFIKFVCLKVIPIATLIIFVSYGISVIFDNLSITYLTYNTTTEQYVFEWHRYFANITNNEIFKPFENLGEAITIILKPIKSIIKIWEDGYDFGDIGISIINILITLLDIIIWLLDMVISIVQCLIKVLGLLLNLIGINTNGNIALFRVFRSISKLPLIPGLNGIS